jgi:hypothetical protein
MHKFDGKFPQFLSLQYFRFLDFTATYLSRISSRASHGFQAVALSIPDKNTITKAHFWIAEPARTGLIFFLFFLCYSSAKAYSLVFPSLVMLTLSLTALGPIWHSESITHEWSQEPGIRDKIRPERSSFILPVMFPNQEGVQSRQSCVIIHSLISGSEMIDWSLIYFMYQSIPLCTLQLPVDL